MNRAPLSYKVLLLIGVGGALGALSRYGLSLALPSHPWPFATMITNVFACALMGLILGLAATKFTKIPWLLPLFTTGFCGGFSTLSTYAVEAHHLGLLQGIAMSLTSIVLCVLVCALAYQTVRHYLPSEADEVFDVDVEDDLASEIENRIAETPSEAETKAEATEAEATGDANV